MAEKIATLCLMKPDSCSAAIFIIKNETANDKYLFLILLYSRKVWERAAAAGEQAAILLRLTKKSFHQAERLFRPFLKCRKGGRFSQKAPPAGIPIFTAALRMAPGLCFCSLQRL